MKTGIFSVIALLATATVGLAQDFAQGRDPFEVARANGGCPGRVIVTAVFTAANQISVTCGNALPGAAAGVGAAAAGGAVTNIVPVLGGLGPLLGIGAAGAAAAALGGGGSTSDTQ